MIQSIVRMALQWFRRLFVRVSLYAALAFLSVLASVYLAPYLPESLTGFVDANALRIILTTLGTSMLAVTTFSLSILSSSYHFVATNISPRASGVIGADTTTHSVLATFIGAFLFSLTGIMLLATPWMTDAAVFVLFAVTLLVAVQIIVSMIRWINHIELLSSYEGTISLLNDQALVPMGAYATSPCLGCNLLREDDPLHRADGILIRAQCDGYVQQILEKALQEFAQVLDARILCLVQPGDFVTSGEPVAVVLDVADVGAGKQKEIAMAFVFREGRSFDQDPEFGLSVMADIGVRALSPGVNDPGTAVDIIHRLSALLQRAAPETRQGNEADEIENDRVWIAPVPLERLYRASLERVARYLEGESELDRALAQAYRRLDQACNKAGAKAARASAARLEIFPFDDDTRHDVSQ